MAIQLAIQSSKDAGFVCWLGQCLALPVYKAMQNEMQVDAVLPMPGQGSAPAGELIAVW